MPHLRVCDQHNWTGWVGGERERIWREGRRKSERGVKRERERSQMRERINVTKTHGMKFSKN